MSDLERAARAAYTRTQGSVSDEDWREVWAFHTDPHSTAMGGPWYLLQCVTATIEALLDPSEAAVDVAMRTFARTLDWPIPRQREFAAMRAAIRAYHLKVLGR